MLRSATIAIHSCIELFVDGEGSVRCPSLRLGEGDCEDIMLFGRTGALIAIWLLLPLACVQDGDSIEEPTPAELAPFYAPDAWGPYPVGSRTEFIDDPRHDVLMKVEIWYPAEPGAEGSGTFAFSRSVPEANVDRSGGPYPVVVFSHGNMGIPEQSLFHTEWLASHGYLVIAPEHPHNSFASPNPAEGDEIGRVAYNRPLDVSAALDFLLELNERPDQLTGLVDGSRVGVSGHSFGAWTAMMIAGQIAFDTPIGGLPGDVPPTPWDLRDERFGAAIAMAPAGAATNDAGQTKIPMLYLGGERDNLTPYESEVLPLYEATPSPAWLLSFPEAGHFSFSHMCEIYPSFAEDDGCGEGWIAPARVFELTNRVAGAFFGVYVKGDERYRSWLDDDAPLGADASLASR